MIHVVSGLVYRQTPSFSNRVALAGAFYQEGSYPEAAEHYCGAQEQEPRDPEVFLAQYLDKVDKVEEARDVLKETLSEHDRSPRFLRRRNFRNALRAKSMLKAIGRA